MASEVSDDEPGVAKIKKEFLLLDYKPVLDTQFISGAVLEQLETEQNEDTENALGPPNKRMKLKGRNKHRPKGRIIVEASEKLCPAYVKDRDCSFGDRCKFSHDKAKFLEAKPEDIGNTCYLFDTHGKCPYGVTCRFAKSHTSEDLKNVTKEDFDQRATRESHVSNVLTKDLQVSLWKRRYDFSKADKIVEKICPRWNNQKKRPPKDTGSQQIQCSPQTSECKPCEIENLEPQDSPVIISNSIAGEGNSCADIPTSIVDVEGATNGASTITLGTSVIVDTPIAEVKQVDFSNKLYLAPLTTVGNLPFRRICKRYGADITCGEMAVVTNLLQGQQSEWALLKRHESEDVFGVQVCGGFPDSFTRVAQVICEEMNVDFIDINCGCPIDLIFNKGEGSALMGRQQKFEQIIRSMRAVMDVPLTVKIRTGIQDDKKIAHNLVPQLRDWGVAMTTLHGRSRQQRYTKLADWDYIHECAVAASPMPLFGNGDILSYEDAIMHREQTGVSGLMIARGALIKPWVFTEIKEQRHWDIRSSERLDMLRDYANYGLDHWGSDHQGVENTRKFLLEWLSFLHRYIPVGVLERVPQQINERPPYYQGRDDLETLMASPNCGDWIKISEMLLGPVPSGFTFLPKHKANAYK